MDTTPARDYFTGLQARIVARLEEVDGQPFRRDVWQRPEGGGGESRLLEQGNVFERGGVNFSHVMGDRLPPSATAGRPHLAGRSFEVMGVSLVLHPVNPYVPDRAHERAHVRRGQGGRRIGVVVRRRHGSHAVLRVRGRRCSFPSHVPRRAVTLRCRLLPSLQALVRRVLFPEASQRAARHRWHILRRPMRSDFRANASR